jgi:hypothetical protein
MSLNLSIGKSLGTLQRRIDSFIRRVKRLIDYIPVIWKGYDFDYSYALELFLVQLERTAKHIETHGYREDRQWVADRIRLAVKLANMGFNGGYTSELFDYYEKEFGPSEIVSTPSEYGEDMFSIEIRYKRAKTTEMNEQIHEALREDMIHSTYRELRARELFFKILEKDLQRFWD